MKGTPAVFRFISLGLILTASTLASGCIIYARGTTDKNDNSLQQVRVTALEDRVTRLESKIDTMERRMQDRQTTEIAPPMDEATRNRLRQQRRAELQRQLDELSTE
jgi:TolA-binding protein